MPRKAGRSAPRRPSSGSSTTAPSSACSLAAKPRPAASTAASSADSQKRRRSKAYVGSSTNEAPGSVARQSTPTPDTKAWATPVIRLLGSGRSLRSNGTDTTSASASDSSMDEVRPPPGPTSTNRVAPAAFACRMLSANRTAARMWLGPVVGRREVISGQLAGHVGDDRNGDRIDREFACRRFEFADHRLHQRRVEGVRDRELVDSPALGAQLVGDGGHRVLVAGNHHRRRAVDRGDADVVGQQRAHFVLGGLHARPWRRRTAAPA